MYVSGQSENAISTYVLEQASDGGRGYVHSVFARSLNVDVDGFLIHVGGPESPLSCIGLNVSRAVIDALLTRADVGDRVEIVRGVLSVHSKTGVTRIDLHALSYEPLLLAPPIPETCLMSLTERLAILDLQKLIGIKQDDRMHGAMSTLSRLDASDEDLQVAMKFLLGRGLGLTPSGDDILMGYGIALRLREKHRAFVRVLRATLAKQTTDVSAAYLRAMMAGYANQGYVELAQAVRQHADAQYGILLHRLQRVGHTSGNDGLFGFSIGLAAS